MRRLTVARLWRFLRREEGSMVVEFALWFPLFAMTLAASLELGLVTVRSMMLERALDMTVREIRLGTGSVPQHDQIKDMICARMALSGNCGQSLRLEMIHRDLRAWRPIPATPDCVDRARPAKPVREFTAGQQNELMVLRACLLFRPMFPTSTFANGYTRNSMGEASLTAITAFVQEPL